FSRTPAQTPHPSIPSPCPHAPPPGRECPDGASWSRRYLGLPAAERPRVPVLVRIADLGMVLEAAAGPALRRDGCQWLLELLESWCVVNGHPVAQDDWRGLFEDGETGLAERR
ncbi:MAG: hypothetical protein GY856_23450, partial [bacterium]|nr:hypothetical protein [bacterium]